MNNQDKIAAKNCINLLLDRKWHCIYELHEKYRLLPSALLKSIRFLERNKLIIVENDNIKLAEDIGNDQISLINSVQKTRKPDSLIKSNLDVSF